MSLCFGSLLVYGSTVFWRVTRASIAPVSFLSTITAPATFEKNSAELQVPEGWQLGYSPLGGTLFQNYGKNHALLRWGLWRLFSLMIDNIMIHRIRECDIFVV